jgi:uncharacterized membrane protein
MFNTTHLHPMIVHFPVALITVGFLAEVISLFFKNEKCLSKTGFYLMVPTQGEIVRLFQKHETGALITMIVMIIGSMFRIWLVMQKKEETKLKWISFGLYLIAFAAVTFTGFMGGNMVYNFMMAL